MCKISWSNSKKRREEFPGTQFWAFNLNQPVEVIKDTKFDESIWIRAPGERGAILFILGNISMPPGTRSTGKEIQRKIGEVEADVQTYKGKEK